MEAAGLMHACYYNDPPKPGIVIKGVSDAADADKAANDKIPIWRKVAAVNSVTLIRNLILSGKLPCLHTDSFSLDEQAGTTAEARAVITESVPVGAALKCFPALIKPEGPLTGLEIRVGAPAGTGLLLLRVIYKDLHGHAKTITATNPVVRITEPLSADAVGVYLLVQPETSRLDFEVSSGKINMKSTTWKKK
ncbi:hypothetical protein ACFFGT_09805 [Mucilaginibacter angelicae]|uniref:Uncharacterized protein n=1 Tax=Mucilaginibacter angelicae TaxID=869718 RepID=A0ABV6L4V1_9SPHI